MSKVRCDLRIENTSGEVVVDEYVYDLIVEDATVRWAVRPDGTRASEAYLSYPLTEVRSLSASQPLRSAAPAPI